MTTKIDTEKTSFTGTELMGMEMPEVQWMVKDILPFGFLWFAGSPKIGKSYFTLQMLIVIASKDRKFLGREVKHGRVLYISFEDNARRLKKRLKELGAPNKLDNLEIETKWRPLNLGGKDDLIKRLKSKKYIMCVINPYNRAFVIKNSNNTDEVTKCLTPLHNMTKSGELMMIFIDHHHKTNQFSGDIIQDVSGSISKVGVADTIWALHRKRGQHDATLEVVSRDTDESTFKMTSENKIWRMVDDIKDETIQSALLDYMYTSEQDSFVSDLAKKFKKDPAQISRELAILMQKGLVRPGKKIGTKRPYTLTSIAYLEYSTNGRNGNKTRQN